MVQTPNTMSHANVCVLPRPLTIGSMRWMANRAFEQHNRRKQDQGLLTVRHGDLLS